MLRPEEKENLAKLEEHFDFFIVPLLNQNDPADLSISWEFKKFLHLKKLKLVTAENEVRKKWKERLLSK